MSMSLLFDRLRMIAETDDDFWQILLGRKGDNGGPFDGGCLHLASAFLNVFPSGELVRIVNTQHNHQTEHYGVRYNNAIFDFDGWAATEIKWIDRFCINEHIESKKLVVVSGQEVEREIPFDHNIINKLTSYFKSKATLLLHHSEIKSLQTSN